MADRFYVNGPLAPGSVMLQGPEAHHLAAVCRHGPGDRVCLFNGDGHEYPAEVVAADRKRVALTVLGVETPERELGFRLEVAAPLPKRDRGDFLIEKLTELGVTAYVPLQTRRSVVHPRESRLDKLQRAVIEASKQCGRNVLMEVRPMAEWADYCARDGLPFVKRVAHLVSDAIPLRVADRSGGVAVAVGPEGGFTDEEVALARSVGWEVVSLGPRVLRVETAAIALAVAAQQ